MLTSNYYAFSYPNIIKEFKEFRVLLYSRQTL